MIDQIVIALFGATAIWLSQSIDARVRRWACICGLITQPAWYWTAWTHEQWGIFAVSFLYTIGWLRGLRNHWLRAA